MAMPCWLVSVAVASSPWPGALKLGDSFIATKADALVVVTIHADSAWLGPLRPVVRAAEAEPRLKRRLAAYITGCEVFQINIRSGYGVADFKADLLSLYTKAGVKATQVIVRLAAGR